MKRTAFALLLLLLVGVFWWQFSGPRAKLRELRRAGDAVVAACVQGDQAELDQRMHGFDLAMHEVDSVEWDISEAALHNRLIEVGCGNGEIGSPEAAQDAAVVAIGALDAACEDRRPSEITRRTEEAAQVISKLRGKDRDYWEHSLEEKIDLCKDLWWINPKLKAR